MHSTLPKVIGEHNVLPVALHGETMYFPLLQDSHKVQTVLPGMIGRQAVSDVMLQPETM